MGLFLLPLGIDQLWILLEPLILQSFKSFDSGTGSAAKKELLFYAVDHPCILAAVSNIQFGSIACTEYSNHYSISVSHYNSFSIYRNSFSTHSNIFGDRESELYVSFISKRSNVSVWERVTILLLKNPC